ncbi:transglutaminase-like domain-containing protein [Breoghania sp. L-A4]|uniref:transglutaminase-like domain-containing protein n=1 Tax=Breoghania sp. L-A4 TaxID=2304600 RepID=UPI000E35D4BD|nr:transglutaminase-like domain-containing protein [Breoghania sp. L-A4]AXS42075.1 transglutaminase domain-containing protein [Breoghania sp. L-A4]
MNAPVSAIASVESTVQVSVEIAPTGRTGARLLAPVGIPTPHQTPLRFSVEGGAWSLTGERHTGQMAALVTPSDPALPMTLRYEYAAGGSGYPEALFVPIGSRHTRPADALVTDALRIADAAADGHAAIATIVADVARKFIYGHPETRFYEGRDAIPHLACGLTEGSCVDINTYLIACLRAAGFDAGYVTGYFFPREKNGCCDDMHCWVMSRHNGVVLEWDIAHHLKMGAQDICCGLNPKPGSRVALAHSMGLDFPELGLRELKLLAEPVWIDAAAAVGKTAVVISMTEGGIDP